MGKISIPLLAIGLLLAAGSLWGQSNELLDVLFEEPEATLERPPTSF